jgi:deoxycytidylate deaminase
MDDKQQLMKMAFFNAENFASCGRRKIGAVLCDEGGQVLASGYNSPEGMVGGECSCEGKNIPAGTGGASGIATCNAIHADALAISKIQDKTLIHSCYSTKAPCPACVEKLLDTGCKEIYFAIDSNDQSNKEKWVSKGLKWEQIDG